MFDEVGEETSSLFQTIMERSSASANYVAKLANFREASDKLHAANDNVEIGNAEYMEALGELDAYFKCNIIHKHIRFEEPNDKGWLEIPVLGNRKQVYARGADEVLLVAGFMLRRKEDLTMLVAEIDSTGEELLNSRLKANIELANNYRAEVELNIAEFKARLAEIKRKFAYIEYLLSIARSQ